MRYDRYDVAGAPVVGLQVACAAWATYPVASGELLLLEQVRPSASLLNPSVRSVVGPPSFQVTARAALPFDWWSVCSIGEDGLLFASAWDPSGSNGGQLALVRDGRVLDVVRVSDAANWSPPVLVAGSDRDSALVMWHSGRSLQVTTCRSIGTRLHRVSTGTIYEFGSPLCGLTTREGVVVVGSGIGAQLTSALIEHGGNYECVPLSGIERGAMYASLRVAGDVVVASVSVGGDYHSFDASHYVLERGGMLWDRYRLGIRGRLQVGGLGETHVVTVGERAAGNVILVDEVCGRAGDRLHRVGEIEVGAGQTVVFSGAEAAHVALDSNLVFCVGE